MAMAFGGGMDDVGLPLWQHKARMWKYTNEELIKLDTTLFQYIATITKHEHAYTPTENFEKEQMMTP